MLMQILLEFHWTNLLQPQFYIEHGGLWLILFAGHFLQKWILAQFGFDLKDHLEVIVLGIVAVTTAPVIMKLVFNKKK